MQCPTCGQKTTVVKTEEDGDKREVLRRRRCIHGHTTRTIESRVVNELANVGVRRTGDLKINGPFDRERLQRDVQNGVLKLLDEAAVYEVCTGVTQELSDLLPRLAQPLQPNEAQQYPDLVGWISDKQVTDAVERRLRRQKARVAHVMYALSVRGRADRPGRPGWHHATDVLNWLFEHYSDLSIDPGSPPETATDTWFPASNAPIPKTVIKLGGDRRPFNQPQFEAGVRRAMLGRPGTGREHEYIVQWVLWGLAGQTSVHVSQLAIGVLDCLRRVDDIAYLRWAAVAKQMHTVTEVRDEAIALITHPSVNLNFRVEARPRRPIRRPSDRD